MKRSFACRAICAFVVALTILSFFPGGAYAQSKPANNTFFNQSNSAVAGKMVSAVPSSTLPFTFSFVSPVNTTGSVIYVGQSMGLFRPGNAAVYFNYTTGAVIPGNAGGVTGGGDYRLHFTQPNPTDTGVNKLGNFGLQNMYIAIGSAAAATDITVQGFRAGRLAAQDVITGLTANAPISSGSVTDLSYSSADDYGGLNVSFGSNWQFMDGIRFIINDRNVPLSIDDIFFNDPTSIVPTAQATGVNASSTTGISTTINWTKGSGDGTAVFIKAAGTGTPTVVDGTTYTGNASLGSGSTTGNGWSCVYSALDNFAIVSGTTNSVNVSNLTPGTTYKVMVVSYNGSVDYRTYNTSENQGGTINSTNFTTIAIPTTQASNVSVTPDYTDFRKATINFTRGNGARSAVFVRNNTTTTDATVAPLNNNNNADASHYTYLAFTDSSSVTANGRVGTSEWYCVFNGAGSGTNLPASVDMTKISNRPGQTLRVMVVDYNGGAGSETYNVTSASGNVVDYLNPGFPLPVTNAATSVTFSSAVLNGSIDPQRGDITNGIYFYSSSPSLSTILGTVATLTPVATSISGAASPTAVAGSVTSLSPSTTYYYRLSATSNAGTFTATNNTGGASNGIRSFTTAPAISSVSASTANGFYKAGAVITVTVGFTAAVTVTGTPTIALNSGATVNYTSGSGTNTLSFNYTVAPGQASTDLDYTSINALVLSGGTIKNIDGNDALLTLPAVGGVSSLGGQKNIVIDTQAPTLTGVAIGSDNAISSIARPGNVIIVAFTTSEAISAPTVTIAGHTASATSTGNNWTASYTLTTSDASGNVPFSIVYNDVAGNDGTVVSATSNSSTVTFDKTPPTLTVVSVASNNANTSLAKVGNTITLSFRASETIATPTVSIRGNIVAATNTGSNNWTAVYTAAAGDESGVVPFSITFVDRAGNSAIAVTATTNGSSVRFDKLSPSLNIVTIVSDNSNTALAKTGNQVILNFTATESITVTSATIAGNTAAISNTGGNNWIATYVLKNTDAAGIIPFSIAFADLAGNTGITVSASTNGSAVTFDKSIPSLTVVSISSDNGNASIAKVGNIVTLSFTASETITMPAVVIAGNTASVSNTSGNSWTARYTLKDADAAGVVTFNISFSDLAGNAGAAVAITTNGATVTFDKSAPSLTSVSISSNNSNGTIAKTGNVITLSFTANKTITTPTVLIAGNAAIVTNTNGNAWSAIYTLKDADAAGTIQFSISFADLTGNSGVTVTATTDGSSVVFDKSVTPVAGISFTGGISLPVGICINAADKNISSLLQVTGVTTGVTLTWSLATQPAHGTVAGFPASATATSSTIAPAGLLYKPINGYSGTDAFVVSASNGISTITTTVTVSVSAAPVSQITATQGTVLCGAGATLTLEASGGNSYAWFSNGVPLTTTTASKLTVSTTGSYSVTVTNANGCSASAANNIVVTQLLKPTAGFSFDSYCTGKAINFTNQSISNNSGSVTYLWSDGTNTSATASPNFTYTQPGTYNMTLTVTPSACPSIADNITKAIAVEAPAAATRMPSVNVLANTTNNLQARNFGNTYSWSPANGLTGANTSSPAVNISKEQEYTITIGMLSGCVTVDTLLVRIFASAGIILPNVFTPNGDGVNDNLLPNLVDVKVFQYFRVFNRSGKKVFESNDPTKGWDGKVNGEKQPAGTYMWSAAGLDKNGALVHKEGSITILR